MRTITFEHLLVRLLCQNLFGTPLKIGETLVLSLGSRPGSIEIWKIFLRG